MLSEMISGVMKNYESASYMTQQKARIFLFLEWIIFILVVLVTLVMNLAIESDLVSSRNAVRLAVLLMIMVAYVLLRAGKYGMAVNLCIFGSLAVMGAQVISTDFATSLEFSNRLFVLYVFIILAAMFSTAWSTFVSMALLIAIAAAAGMNTASLPPAEVKNTIVNFTVSAVIISVVSFVLMRMVDSTIARIEASLQKEREHSMMKDLLESGLNLSGELASLSEHLKEENLNLSQRTVEHSAALEEVSATIEQTVAAIRQNAQSTGHASELTEEATRVAEEGARMINEAVDFIRDIDQSGEKIGQITAVINDIAFQTNILALNAAIEAARAGEAGRGFAVVAGEVRNLAARAGAAAGEISGLISQSISRIHQGSELVGKSGKALENISASVREVEMVVRDITRQSDEQHRGIEDIRASITQMDLVVQENSALVERTSAVSDTLSRQARDLMSMLQGKNAANGKAAMLS